MYRMIVSDLDGTLLNEHHQISPRTQKAIAAARAKGVHFVPASGRPYLGMEQYVNVLSMNTEGNYVISSNGSLVQEAGGKDALIELSLSFSDVVRSCEIAKRFNSHIHFLDHHNIYTPNHHIGKYSIREAFLTEMPLYCASLDSFDPAATFTKIMFIDEPEVLDQIMQNAPEDFKADYHVIKSMPFFLEVLHPDANKGAAVKALAQKLEIPMEEIICIGDQENDALMIEAAGLGVAMENAVPETKKVADVITSTNEDDGVAKIIEQYVLEL